MAARAGRRDAAPRVLVLLAKGFNRTEFYTPWADWAAMGIDLEIASFEKGAVFIDLNESPHPGLDAEATLSFDEVKPERYAGLFVPGGYSPGFLEKDPRALEIVRAFAKAGKPMGFICHGPRLLLRADLLRGRNFTCLFTLPDELADLWRERPFGAYLDQPVVVDGNLVTARYPNDAKPFAQALGAMLLGKPVEKSQITPSIVTSGKDFPTVAPQNPDAVLALREGFDERAAAMALEALKKAGRTHVLLCGAVPGKVRSANGVEVTVAAAFPETLPPGTLIVAPGFFWPQKNEQARQAVQPAWIEDQEKADAAREAWLLRQREAGATLLLVGLDALRIGRQPQFHGAKFATSEQAVWSFPKEGGVYTHDPFCQTAERLFTASGPAAVADAISAAVQPLPK